VLQSPKPGAAGWSRTTRSLLPALVRGAHLPLQCTRSGVALSHFIDLSSGLSTGRDDSCERMQTICRAPPAGPAAYPDLRLQKRKVSGMTVSNRQMNKSWKVEYNRGLRDAELTLVPETRCVSESQHNGHIRGAFHIPVRPVLLPQGWTYPLLRGPTGWAATFNRFRHPPGKTYATIKLF